jgi:hypothetical protein
MRGEALLNFFQQSMQQEQGFRLGHWVIAWRHLRSSIGAHSASIHRSNAAKSPTSKAPWHALHSKVALLSIVR